MKRPMTPSVTAFMTGCTNRRTARLPARIDSATRFLTEVFKAGRANTPRTTADSVLGGSRLRHCCGCGRDFHTEFSMRSGHGAVVGDFPSDESSATPLTARDEGRHMGKESDRF